MFHVEHIAEPRPGKARQKAEMGGLAYLAAEHGRRFNPFSDNDVPNRTCISKRM